MAKSNLAVTEIGTTLRDARLERGYQHRTDLAGTRKLKGKITAEGIRKIEESERVPKLETLKIIGDTLGLNTKTMKKLERAALKMAVTRSIRRQGNVDVSFRIEGEPVKLFAVPPARKVESFVRETIEDLVILLDKYGCAEQDQDHFRRHGRAILLKKLEK